MAWHREPLTGFDLETTGTGPLAARIVSGAVAEPRAGARQARGEWPADPGIPIPAGATAVHGITTERATAEGAVADRVADALAEALASSRRAGVPVVAYNAAFHPRAPHASQVSHPAGRGGDRLHLEPAGHVLASGCPSGVL